MAKEETLEVKLLVGLKQFQKGLRTAGKQVATFASKAGRAVVGITKAFGSLARAGIRTGKRLAAGLGAAYIGLQALQYATARAGDELAKMSKRTGMSVRFLSEMKHVLDLNDASLAEFGIAMRGMARTLLMGGEGAKQAVDTFKALGIRVQTTGGRLKDAETLFIQTAKALARVSNATLRAAYAQRILGRGGEALLPTILDMAKGFKAARKEAHELGITWTTKAAKAAEDFMDNVSRLKSLIKGLGQTFAKELLPHTNEAMEQLTAWGKTLVPRARKWGQAFRAFAEEWGEKISRVAGIAGRAAEAAFGKIVTWWDAQGEAVMGKIAKAWDNLPGHIFASANAVYKFGKHVEVWALRTMAAVKWLVGGFVGIGTTIGVLVDNARKYWDVFVTTWQVIALKMLAISQDLFKRLSVAIARFVKQLGLDDMAGVLVLYAKGMRELEKVTLAQIKTMEAPLNRKMQELGEAMLAGWRAGALPLLDEAVDLAAQAEKAISAAKTGLDERTWLAKVGALKAALARATAAGPGAVAGAVDRKRPEAVGWMRTPEKTVGWHSGRKWERKRDGAGGAEPSDITINAPVNVKGGVLDKTYAKTGMMPILVPLINRAIKLAQIDAATKGHKHE